MTAGAAPVKNTAYKFLCFPKEFQVAVHGTKKNNNECLRAGNVKLRSFSYGRGVSGEFNYRRKIALK